MNNMNSRKQCWLIAMVPAVVVNLGVSDFSDLIMHTMFILLLLQISNGECNLELTLLNCFNYLVRFFSKSE